MVQRQGVIDSAGVRRPRGARRAAAFAVVLAVVVVHGCVTADLAQRMQDAGAVAQMPQRIEVAYVREMMPAAPPALAPQPRSVPPAAAKPPRPRPARPSPAASMPAEVATPSEAASTASAASASDAEPPARTAEAAASAPEVATLGERELPASSPVLPEATVVASVPAASMPAVSNEPPAVAPPTASASAPAFEWPASTRLSYQLTGNVRGEVHGSAQVEWVRVGNRYQVHLDVTVGLPVAPLLTRRMSSDGELTDQGLVPQRYDEDTKVMFRDRRRVTMLFEPDAVQMPNGQRRERWPGVQDTASQFVQLSWLFTTRPELLRTGGMVEIPLALPRSVDRWVYDVLEEETVYTSFGELQAFHLKPRRTSRPGGDLIAEIWFAPRLRYLPVRIRIQQDSDTFIDLMLARRPEMAGP
jgi:Protein of unknown function (DUF3108)